MKLYFSLVMIPLNVNIIINQILIFDYKNYSFSYINNFVKNYLLLDFTVYLINILLKLNLK